MQSCRFPVEICERIISSCQDMPVSWITRNETLTACALTCSAWLPRSRHTLYHKAVLSRAAQCESFLSTLDEHPLRAKWVKILEIWAYEYLPLARLLKVGLFTSCYHLSLGLEWRVYPPHYAHRVLVPLLAAQTRVVSLHLDFQLSYPGAHARAMTFSQFLHILWSLPQLQRLVIRDAPPEIKLWNLTRFREKNDFCANLKELHILGHKLCTLKHFAPPGLFGVSVTVLKLELNAHDRLSETMLQCISDFRLLEELTLSIWFGTPVRDVNLLQDVLLNVQPARFKTLVLELGPSLGSYGMDRDELLDLIADCAVKQALSDFRHLTDIQVTLTDEDAYFGESWWTAQLRDRLRPELTAGICTTVDLDTDYIGLWSKDVPGPSEDEDEYDDDSDTLSEDPGPLDGSDPTQGRGFEHRGVIQTHAQGTRALTK